jgi:hypothetical protein
MRHLVTTAMTLLGLAAASSAGAERIPDGSYRQKFSDYGAGQCPDCVIYVRQKTPNTIEILANNGWVGSAYYEPSVDSYTGFFEWRKNSGLPYVEGVLHKITLRYEARSKTLSMEGERPGLSFRAIFTK